MAAIDALRRGDLTEAFEQLRKEVRSKPQDPALRVFLFQLFSIMGQWDRALAQLNVSGQLDPAVEMMVKAYTETLMCERLRAEIFAGKRTPLVLGEPEQWVAALIQSLSLRGDGRYDAASRLRDQAFEAAPATGGALSWRTEGSGGDEVIQVDRFQWLADAEMSLGPVLEAILNGRYYWVPLNRMASVRIEPPEDLRDLVWLPAQFTWVGGGQQVGFIPTRYFGSENADDDAVRMARKTQWVVGAGGQEVGQGQRMLATDSGEYSLLDVRLIEFDPSEPPVPDATSEAGEAHIDGGMPPHG
jgi:type VI secretion system protein ImpE